jgi:alkyl hydroperoxide reductase subunit AhpC
MAIQVGSPAPDFSANAVVGSEFKQVSLADYKGKWVVLFFYPLDFTFVWPTEIVAFSDRADEFRKHNAEVLGASIDSQFSHLAWTNQPRNKGGLGKINYPILSDITKNISRDYGVLLEDKGIALRGTFIIDPDGILRNVVVQDLPIGRSIDDTLRVLTALQHSSGTGEVCPADWGKEKQAINPAKAGEWFEKNAK